MNVLSPGIRNLSEQRNFYCSCKLCDYSLHYFCCLFIFLSENNSENSACAESWHNAGKNLHCPVITLPKHFISFIPLARDREKSPCLSKAPSIEEMQLKIKAAF